MFNYCTILLIACLATDTVKGDDENSVGWQKERKVIDDNADTVDSAQKDILNILQSVYKINTKPENKTVNEKADLFVRAPYSDNSQSTSMEQEVDKIVKATKQYKLSFAPAMLSKEYEEEEENHTKSKENSTVTNNDQIISAELTQSADNITLQDDEQDYQNDSIVNKPQIDKEIADAQGNNDESDSSISEDIDIVKINKDELKETYKKATIHSNSNKKIYNDKETLMEVKEKQINKTNEDHKHDLQDNTVIENDRVARKHKHIKSVKHLVNKKKETKEHKHGTRHSKKYVESKPRGKQQSKMNKKSVPEEKKNSIRGKHKNIKAHHTKLITKKTINSNGNKKIEQKDDVLVQKIKNNLTPFIKALINEERKTEKKVTLPTIIDKISKNNAPIKETDNKNKPNPNEEGDYRIYAWEHKSDVEKITEQINNFDSITENEIRVVPPVLHQTYMSQNMGNQNDKNLIKEQNVQEIDNDNDDGHVDAVKGLENQNEDNNNVGVMLPSLGEDDEEMTITKVTTEHINTTKKAKGKFHMFIGKIREGLRERINKILSKT